MIWAVLKRKAPAECAGHCRDCTHFDNRPAALEAAFPGLSAMSSGYASVRAQDGLCRTRDIYLPAGATCRDFAARPA